MKFGPLPLQQSQSANSAHCVASGRDGVIWRVILQLRLQLTNKNYVVTIQRMPDQKIVISNIISITDQRYNGGGVQLCMLKRLEM